MILLQICNIICICIYLIKNIYILYICRFFHGYLGCAYGFLALIMILENLPSSLSNIWSSMFYTFVSIGYIISYLFYSEN